MASGSFSGSVCDGHYKLLIEWTGTSSTANNNSVVKVTAKLVNDWGLDIGSRTGTITIDGTDYSISSSAISSKGTHTLGTASRTVSHNSDGKRNVTIKVRWYMKATISGYGYINYIETSKTVALDSIPRYATSTQSLKSKTGTSIVMNWSSNNTIDYIWYSTNGGTSWTASGSVNATSGSYTISGLSAGTTYSIKTRVRRKDSGLTTDSSALSVTTYAYPTCTISNTSKTETSITIKWTSNKTINKYWYSTNNGSTWTEKSASSTNATFTISSLSANTAYNIKVRVQASESSLQTTSSTLAVTTYQFPYVSSVGISQLTIGNNQTLTLYNPLGRSVTVYMRQNNVSGTIFDSETTSDTSVVLKPTASDLYASIPNSKSGTAYYYVEYSGHRPNPKTGTYTVPASSAPTVSTLTYEDINTAVQNVIQNNQLIVQNKSQVKFTCTGLTAKNSASISSAKVVVDNQTINLTISGSSASGFSSVISVASATTATLTVTDSRGLTATKTVEINMLAWSSPTGLITMQRQDNYYSLTYITVDAIYSSLDGKNAVTIEYTARATGQTDITGTLQDNVQGSFTADNTLDWTVSITITDALNGTTTYYRTLPRGTPIIFFDSKKYSVGINCFPDGDHRFEILSTDGNSQHDVAQTLEQHEDGIDFLGKEEIGWINGLPTTNIDDFPTYNIYGTYWCNLYDTGITGTLPTTRSGQGLFICKKQQTTLYRQIYIGISGAPVRKFRYYTISTGVWTEWEDWSSEIETVSFTPASGVNNGLFIRKSGRTVTINGYCSGVTFSGANVSTVLGTLSDYYPPYTIRALCAIGANAYSVGTLGYVALDANGSLYARSPSALSNRAVYFSIAYAWTERS